MSDHIYLQRPYETRTQQRTTVKRKDKFKSQKLYEHQNCDIGIPSWTSLIESVIVFGVEYDACDTPEIMGQNFPFGALPADVEHVYATKPSVSDPKLKGGTSHENVRDDERKWTNGSMRVCTQNDPLMSNSVSVITVLCAQNVCLGRDVALLSDPQRLIEKTGEKENQSAHPDDKVLICMKRQEVEQDLARIHKLSATIPKNQRNQKTQ